MPADLAVIALIAIMVLESVVHIVAIVRREKALRGLRRSIEKARAALKVRDGGER